MPGFVDTVVRWREEQFHSLSLVSYLLFLVFLYYFETKLQQTFNVYSYVSNKVFVYVCVCGAYIYLFICLTQKYECFVAPATKYERSLATSRIR